MSRPSLDGAMAFIEFALGQSYGASLPTQHFTKNKDLRIKNVQKKKTYVKAQVECYHNTYLTQEN